MPGCVLRVVQVLPLVYIWIMLPFIANQWNFLGCYGCYGFGRAIIRLQGKHGIYFSLAKQRLYLINLAIDCWSFKVFYRFSVDKFPN